MWILTETDGLFNLDKFSNIKYYDASKYPNGYSRIEATDYSSRLSGEVNLFSSKDHILVERAYKLIQLFMKEGMNYLDLSSEEVVNKNLTIWWAELRASHLVS